MGGFYSLLKDYNIENYNLEKVPHWAYIFTEDTPPIYFSILKKLLVKLPKHYKVLEIGSGLGDILALIFSLGFSDVIGIERNKRLCTIAAKKIESLFSFRDRIICDNYPCKTPFIPDILIQVNCVYHDNSKNKGDYLNDLKKNFDLANPKFFFLEVVDVSFKANHSAYPEFVRLSEDDIKGVFSEQKVKSIETYVFPHNSSSKKIYIIESLDL